MTKSSLGRKGFISFPFVSQFIVEGIEGRNLNRAGTWRQELMQRPWRAAAYWLAPTVNYRLGMILRFISYVLLSLKDLISLS